MPDTDPVVSRALQQADPDVGRILFDAGKDVFKPHERPGYDFPVTIDDRGPGIGQGLYNLPLFLRSLPDSDADGAGR